MNTNSTRKLTVVHAYDTTNRTATFQSCCFTDYKRFTVECETAMCTFQSKTFALRLSRTLRYHIAMYVWICRSAEKGGMENPNGRSFVNIALTKYSSAALRGRQIQYALINYVHDNVIMIITFYTGSMSAAEPGNVVK